MVSLLYQYLVRGYDENKTGMFVFLGAERASKIVMRPVGAIAPVACYNFECRNSGIV